MRADHEVVAKLQRSENDEHRAKGCHSSVSDVAFRQSKVCRSSENAPSDSMSHVGCSRKKEGRIHDNKNCDHQSKQCVRLVNDPKKFSLFKKSQGWVSRRSGEIPFRISSIA